MLFASSVPPVAERNVGEVFDKTLEEAVTVVLADRSPVPFPAVIEGTICEVGLHASGIAVGVVVLAAAVILEALREVRL